MNTFALMDTDNDNNAIAIIPPNTPYDDAVWEILFEIWMYLADRNCSRTRQKFIDSFRDNPTFQTDRVPSVRSIQYRAKSENWDLKANKKIRQQAEYINDNQLGRIIIISDKALDLLDRIIEGEFLNHPKTGNVQIMFQAAIEALKIRGLGTAGAIGQPQLTVEVRSGKDADVELSTQERSDRMREHILKGKQTKKLTGIKK